MCSSARRYGADPDARSHGEAFLNFFQERLVPKGLYLLDEPVTSFQQTAVVTEQGVAALWGYDEKTQARNLIEHAAHPSVRSELWEEARALFLT